MSFFSVYRNTDEEAHLLSFNNNLKIHGWMKTAQGH